MLQSGSIFWNQQVIFWYTNRLPYELGPHLKHCTDRATTELTSIQNECALGGQSAVIHPSLRRHHITILAGATGLEPAASCVTGRRSNQLNYASAFETPIPCDYRVFLRLAIDSKTS